MTETSKSKNNQSQSESRLLCGGLPEVLSLVALWNELYGRIMYRLPIPEEGDPVYRMFCDRISEHGYSAVREAIIRVGQSKYLLGRKGLPPIAISSLLRPQIFSKVLTGYYSDYPRHRPAKRVPGEKKEAAGQDVSADPAAQSPSPAALPEENRPKEKRPAQTAASPAPRPAKDKRGIERDADLDAWLIDQIVHKKMHDLPPAPADCTDWEAYMS